MNEPTVIKKFEHVCNLNCGHASYCEYHKDRDKASHLIKPSTAKRMKLHNVMEWVCHNFRADAPAPANPKTPITDTMKSETFGGKPR